MTDVVCHAAGMKRLRFAAALLFCGAFLFAAPAEPAPNEYFLYVSNERSGDVTVIDARVRSTV
jgi:hypothetical protein